MHQKCLRKHDGKLDTLVLHNQLNRFMNLCQALMLALYKEYKSSKKPLPRVLNLNVLRAGEVQRRDVIVSNSFFHRNILCNSPSQICSRFFLAICYDIYKDYSKLVWRILHYRVSYCLRVGCSDLLSRVGFLSLQY